jgi:antitoxin (DNA-binding transcriptional repressor) of toxin-antitoxin stability system
MGKVGTGGDVARNFAAVLERVRQVVEVIIEQDARPIAVLKSTPRTGGPISECIAIAKARGTKAAVDEGFAKDVEEAIRSHQEPWNPALLGLILDTSVGLPRSGAVLRVV